MIPRNPPCKVNVAHFSLGQNQYFKKAAFFSFFFISIIVVNHSKAQDKKTEKLINTAKELVSKHEYKAALSIYNQLLEKDESYIGLYSLRANAHELDGEIDLAVQDYSEGINRIISGRIPCDLTEYFSEKRGCHLEDLIFLLDQRSQLYLKQGNRVASIQDLAAATRYIHSIDVSHLSPQPAYSSCLILQLHCSKMATIYLNQKQIDSTIALYEKLISIETYHNKIPYDQDVLTLAQLYQLSGNYAKAVANFEPYLKNYFKPEYDLGKTFNCIEALLSLRQFNKAKEILDVVSPKGFYYPYIGDDGKKTALYGIRGYFLHKNQREEYYLDTGKGPSYADYLESIVKMLAQNQYEPALSRLLKEEGKYYKNDSVAYEMINGRIYIHEFPTILSLKGYILGKLNRKEEANAAYKLALAITPNCPEVLEELKRLN